MPSPLQITFIAHACLRLDCDGQSLLLDPYSSVIGYAPVDQSVGVAVLSHENQKYHSCLDDVRADEVMRALERLDETLERGPFQISFVEVFEKAPDGSPDFASPNAMTLIEVAGLRVLHMGDCGHLPTPSQIEACGQVDVLLALAGAGPTLDLPDVVTFAVAVAAKITIPMHYGLPGWDGRFAPIGELEKLWAGEIVGARSSSCEITRANLPDAAQLRILKPLRWGN